MLFRHILKHNTARYRGDISSSYMQGNQDCLVVLDIWVPRVEMACRSSGRALV